MNPRECSQFSTCPKISMILDKDLSLDQLYACAIMEVCEKCSQPPPLTISGIMEVYEGEVCSCVDAGRECREPHYSIFITTDDGKVIECEDLPKRARVLIQEEP